MSHDQSGRARRRVTTVAATLALIIAVPVAVIAAHSFDDVPDSNQFHESIAWMQENGITIGCNPPANTQYCPEDNVSRQQMAAFMRRLAQTDGSAGIGVTDPADTVTVSGTTYVELLTLESTPTAEANVTLNAHVTLSKPRHRGVISGDRGPRQLHRHRGRGGRLVRRLDRRIRHRRGDGVGCCHGSGDIRSLRRGDSRHLSRCDGHPSWTDRHLGRHRLS